MQLFSLLPTTIVNLVMSLDAGAEGPQAMRANGKRLVCFYLSLSPSLSLF